MQLDHWAKMAQMHWEKYLPNYYSSLQKQGNLEQELQKAGNKAREMIADLMESGLRRDEAVEIVLPQYILLTPEKDLEPIEEY